MPPGLPKAASYYLSQNTNTQAAVQQAHHHEIFAIIAFMQDTYRRLKKGARGLTESRPIEMDRLQRADRHTCAAPLELVGRGGEAGPIK